MNNHSKTVDTYQDRIVAFIDILGFRNLVANGEVATIYNAMEIIKKKIKFFKRVRDSPLATSQFSDSVILSAPNDDKGLVSRFRSSYAHFACVSSVRRQKRSMDARMSPADFVQRNGLGAAFLILI